MSVAKASPVTTAPPRTWQRVAAIAAIFAAMVVGLLIYQLHRAPDFYRAAVAQPPQEQQQASDEFLSNVSATVSQAQRPGAWSTEFSEEQVNGWLAFDLPRNHPELLGDTGYAPRIDLEENLGRIAFEYRGLVTTVVCLEFNAEVRDERTVAIRLQSLRGGALPLPLGAVMEEVNAAASQLEQPIRWTEEDGRPVALIDVPDWEDEGKAVRLVDVRLEEGRLLLVGETTPVTKR